MPGWSWNLNDACSPQMEQLSFFHDYIMIIVTFITTLTLCGALLYFTHSPTHRLLIENQSVELAWTIIPGATLILIGAPSLRILYLLDEIGDPAFTLKVIGHQWYWSYEMSDMGDSEYDAYMAQEGSKRLLTVDHRVVSPAMTPTRVVLTAADVLHSWTVPVLGIKSDCCPGRLNQMMAFISRVGIFHGQCSEICGSNHAFMPISLEAILASKFLSWM